MWIYQQIPTPDPNAIARAVDSSLSAPINNLVLVVALAVVVVSGLAFYVILRIVPRQKQTEATDEKHDSTIELAKSVTALVTEMSTSRAVEREENRKMMEAFMSLVKTQNEQQAAANTILNRNTEAVAASSGAAMGRWGAIGTQVDNLKEAVDMDKEAIKELKEQVNALESSVNKLTAEVAKPHDIPTDVKLQIAAITTQVCEINLKLDDLLKRQTDEVPQTIEILPKENK